MLIISCHWFFIYKGFCFSSSYNTKRKKIKLFVFLTLISSVIIIVTLAILWIENSNIIIILSLVTSFYDIYLDFVYYYSGGLFSFIDDKISVLMYDYGLFASAAYGFLMMLYPLY